MENCKLDSLRGFNYKLYNGIINCGHLVKEEILMPLANSIQLFNGEKAVTIFEAKREINAIDLKGSMLVIGEKAMPGQLISAILVDIRELEHPREFNYQKTQINLIALSSDGQFIASLGCSSQGNQELNIIEVNNQSQIGTRVFYSRILNKKDGKAVALKFSNKDPTCFVLMCENRVTINHIDTETESIEEAEIKTSKVRQYNSFVFSPDDRFIYGCSKNGDIAEMDLEEGREVRIGPRRRVITKGITHIQSIQKGHLIICGKEGFVAIIELKQFKIVKDFTIDQEEIVSLSSFQDGQTYISTNRAIIYRFQLKQNTLEQIYTCHTTQINAIAAIKDFPDIFGTCSAGDIIIWSTQQLKPALKISLPKISCLSLCFPRTGRHIISGWSDDCIRIFSPKNGEQEHKLTPAALGKVKVIISDDESTRIICGGDNGVIRMWNIMPKDFGLILGSFAFHSKAVHNLKINQWNPGMLASCSEDGQVGVWNLKTMQILNSFFICNYVMDIHFLSSTTIQVAGAGNIIYECLLSNGEIKGEMEMDGTCINSIVHFNTKFTDEHLILVGGDTNYLQFYDKHAQTLAIHTLQSYGPIWRMILTADKQSVLAVTENGIILKYNIFAITTKKEDE